MATAHSRSLARTVSFLFLVGVGTIVLNWSLAKDPAALNVKNVTKPNKPVLLATSSATKIAPHDDRGATETTIGDKDDEIGLRGTSNDGATDRSSRSSSKGGVANNTKDNGNDPFQDDDDDDADDGVAEAMKRPLVEADLESFDAEAMTDLEGDAEFNITTNGKWSELDDSESSDLAVPLMDGDDQDEFPTNATVDEQQQLSSQSQDNDAHDDLPSSNTTKLSPKSKWTLLNGTYSTLIQSERYFWGNEEGIEYVTHFNLTSTGLVCLDVTINATAKTCPFPDIRARLSGRAMIDIPLRASFQQVESVPQQQETSSSSTKKTKERDQQPAPSMSGCALLPTKGKYYLDMNLLHCTTNAWAKGVTSDAISQQCPVQPKIRKVSDFSFSYRDVHRTADDIPSELTDQEFPYAAWVLAPRCGDYEVSETCRKQNNVGAYMSRTKFESRQFLSYGQYKSFLDERLQFRYDDYTFLPVDLVSGEPQFDSHHSTPLYTPPLPGLDYKTMKETVCFVGESHARYIAYEARRILKNETLGTTACPGKDVQIKSFQKEPGGPVRYHEMMYASSFLRDEAADLSECDFVFVSHGHHDAAYTGGRCIPPKTYRTMTGRLLEKMEQVTKPSASIHILSMNQTPFGSKVLNCDDWRIPSVLRAYDAYLKAATKYTKSGGQSFRKFKKSFFLDNTDITDPLWDSAVDFNHACTYTVRPITERILSIVKRKREAAQQ